MRLPAESLVGIFSVEMSPFDSTTTKRPFAVTSLANELKPAVPEVSCERKGSGVALGVCADAEKNAPEASVNTIRAQNILGTSFTKSSGIKTRIGAD